MPLWALIGAESWGEGDLESIEAGGILEDAFFGEEEDVQGFIFLVYHDSLNDSSEDWRVEVREALSAFDGLSGVDINYSWEMEGDDRVKYVYEDDDGFWAKNRVLIKYDRKEAKELYAAIMNQSKSIQTLSHRRTGNVAIDVTFDTKFKRI